jgi:hypothetical protein
MADMRQIFTYPNNLATNYIDPVYVGDALSGMTRRINHLLDGTYKTWLNPLVLTATTSEVMQNISKFGSFYENVSYGGHLSRYDFWNQPMVVATKKLIDSENVTANVTAQLPMIVTTSNAHEFEDGQRISTSNLNGTWGSNVAAGNFPQMYAKVLSNTTLNIATDEALTVIIGFIGGSQTFNLPAGALDYTSPYGMSNYWPNSTYIDTNVYNKVHIDLSSAIGGFNLSIPDATPITINSVQSSTAYNNDTDIPGTYYLMNTPTTPTDNKFMLYPYAHLNDPTGVTNYAPMRFTAGNSVNRMIEFPLNQDANGVARTVVTATINETYPATVTLSRNLALDERWVWVSVEDQVTWVSSGLNNVRRNFGPLGAYQKWPNGGDTLEAHSMPLYLTPTGNPYEYSVTQPGAANPGAPPDWRRKTYTDTGVVFNFYDAPQITTNPYYPPGPGGPYYYPWANVNNARMRWDLGGEADSYVDGTAINLTDVFDQLQNDPYYLKEVPSLSTSTYKVFDVYKNSGLTNIVGPSDYFPLPSIPSYPINRFYTDGSSGVIRFRENENGVTSPAPVWPNLRTSITSIYDITSWGITAGEILTLTWDSVNETFTVAGKTGTTAPAYIDAYVLGIPGGSVSGEDIPSSFTTGIIPINPVVNTSVNIPLANTTTGQIGPHVDPASNPYEIDTVELILPGNQTYHYRNASNQVVPGAQTNTSKYWEAGSSIPGYYTNGATSATFNTTVDTNGYLQNVTLVEEPDAEGRYPTSEDIIVLIENKTDEHTPSVLPPALQADIFDTHDEWTDNAPSSDKVWPDHVTPASASIVYNQPTIANMSQNGIKYTRSSGFTKWVLEVEYPPMKAKDFQKFHAIAQAMTGQSKSAYFKLRNKDNVSILWADMMDTNSSLSGINIPTAPLDGYTPQGSLTLHLEGLTASDPEAFRQGEVFIANANENGSLNTAIGAAASNVFGEAKVRMPYGLRSNLAQSALVYKNPEWAIVTLNSNAFEYSVDANNYYTVSVAFDLDQWGS